MLRDTFEWWEKGLNFKAVDMADMLGVTYGTYHEWKTGEDYYPTALTYAMAWTLLYGPRPPYDGPVAIAKAIASFVRDRRIRQSHMAEIMGVTPLTAGKWINGDSEPAKYHGYAIAWIRLYGARIPFPNEKASGYQRCFVCKR